MPSLASTTPHHPSRITLISHQQRKHQGLKKSEAALLAAKAQEALLQAPINKPIWESPYFSIDTATRKPTLILISEKFEGFNAERCRAAGTLPIPKLVRESTYVLLKGMVEHYTEHCEAIAEAVEEFQGEERTRSVAEEMRALVRRMQGVVEHVEWSYEDDGFGDFCCFWESMSEVEAVRDLFREVREALLSITEGTYESPRALSCAGVSLVAAAVCRTRREGVWKPDDDLLEEIVATHIGMETQECLLLFANIQRIAYHGKEDTSTLEMRTRIEDLVRKYVKKVTLDLEKKPATRGHNIWGVLEERGYIHTGRQFRRVYRNYTGENGDPRPRVVDMEMSDNDEEPAFL